MKRLLALSFVVLLVVAGCAPWVTPPPTPTPPTPPPQPSMTVTGQLCKDVNLSTGCDVGESGLAGVTVTIAVGTTTWTGVTNASGFYTFSNVTGAGSVRAPRQVDGWNLASVDWVGFVFQPNTTAILHFAYQQI